MRIAYAETFLDALGRLAFDEDKLSWELNFFYDHFFGSLHHAAFSPEVERAINQIEASFYRRMERVGGFGGKADQLNAYYRAAGTPDYFAKDLARYQAVTAADVRAAVEQYLPKDRRVELSVVPGEKK